MGADPSYLHRIDPVAFSVGGFSVRFYPLTYVAGFIVVWLILRWLTRTGRSVVPRSYVGDVLAYYVFAVAVGARLGYVFFYKPALLVDFGGGFPFWGVLRFHEGGMSSHGGMIGVLFACLYMHREKGIPTLHLFDVTALVAPPGLAFGRVGNFVNAELWGKPLPDAQQTWPAGAPDDASPAWAIKYPQELLKDGFDAGRLVEVKPRLLELLGLAPGSSEATWLEATEQALLAGRADVVALVKPHLTAFYPSQLLQALTDGPVLLSFLVVLGWRPRKPGTLAGGFLVAYAVLRVLTEVWRQPDPGVALLFGLSRGQTLSVVLFVAGLVLLRAARRGAGPALLGLGHPAGVGLEDLGTPPSASTAGGDRDRE